MKNYYARFTSRGNSKIEGDNTNTHWRLFLISHPADLAPYINKLVEQLETDGFHDVDLVEIKEV